MKTPIEPALTQARQLLATRRVQEAYAICRRLLEQRPDHAGALVMAGAALSAAGRLEPAIEHLQRALAVEPDRSDAALELALALRASGRGSEALELIERTARRHPDDVAVLNTHGLLLGGAGSYRRAAEVLRQAWRLSSGHPGIGFNLGEAQRKAGDGAAAARTLESVLARAPGHAPALNSLGLVLLAGGRYPAAAERFRAALAQRPVEPRFSENLAQALYRDGRIGEAVEALKAGLKRTPGDAGLMLTLARLYRDVDEFDAARTAYQKAAGADPGRSEIWRELAWLEEQANRLEAAAEAAGAGLALHPEDAALHLLEARLARRRGDLSAARSRLAAIDQARLDLPGRATFRCEQGHLADADDEPSAAWEHFRRGGELVGEAAAASSGHDPDRFPTLAARWGEALRAMPLEAREPAAETPVFVVGFPRSGTTLIDQFLGGHPALITMEEKPALDAVVARARELQQPLPGELAVLTEVHREELRHRYRDAVTSFVTNDEGRRLVDRLPVNVVYLPLIQTLWPGAPVIFAARDPLDVCLSCLMQDFRGNPLTWHLVDPDRCVALYRSFADLWLEFAERSPALCHLLRYEDLVADPERECRRLTTFLGLDWEPAMLDHVATARARRALKTASYHQVVKPLYRSAVRRWHRYREQLEPWVAALRPYRVRFGYEVDDG